METIKKSEVFSVIYNKGEKIHTKYTLIFKYTYTPTFGCVASKKIGNAVVRNRLKRIFREVVRLNMNKFSPYCAYVIVAKKTCSQDFETLKYEKIEKDILLGLKRHEKNFNKDNKNISKSHKKQ